MFIATKLFVFVAVLVCITQNIQAARIIREAENEKVDLKNQIENEWNELVTKLKSGIGKNSLEEDLKSLKTTLEEATKNIQHTITEYSSKFNKPGGATEE